VITIPYDYDEKAGGSVVPICIDDVDREGNLIDFRWIDLGVAPAADQLRAVAKRVLEDVWRVSEIAEYAVHSVWRKHHDNLTGEPSLLILDRARWHAEDLRVGGRRARRKADVELFATTVYALEDAFDLAMEFENRETLDRLSDELRRQGKDDVAEMAAMMIRGADSAELVARFGKKRNTLSQRFYRGMRRAAQVARITW
jgi:hypothetical protein